MNLSETSSGALDLSIFPIVAMILFLCAFAAVVAQLVWAARRDDLSRAARLPLEDAEAPHVAE